MISNLLLSLKYQLGRLPLNNEVGQILGIVFGTLFGSILLVVLIFALIDCSFKRKNPSQTLLNRIGYRSPSVFPPQNYSPRNDANNPFLIPSMPPALNTPWYRAANSIRPEEVNLFNKDLMIMNKIPDQNAISKTKLDDKF